MNFLLSSTLQISNVFRGIPLKMLQCGLIVLALQSPASASMFWTDADIVFSKPNNVDWTLAANQERITDKVWLTRADTQGLFNIAPNQ